MKKHVSFHSALFSTRQQGFYVKRNFLINLYEFLHLFSSHYLILLTPQSLTFAKFTFTLPPYLPTDSTCAASCYYFNLPLSLSLKIFTTCGKKFYVQTKVNLLTSSCYFFSYFLSIIRMNVCFNNTFSTMYINI